MMEAGKLFIVNVDNDLLWMGYLLSFPEGEVRQSHNCNACKSFIRHMGKAAEKAQLLEIIHRKKNQAMKNMSIDELEAKLASLEN